MLQTSDLRHSSYVHCHFNSTALESFDEFINLKYKEVFTSIKEAININQASASWLNYI